MSRVMLHPIYQHLWTYLQRHHTLILRHGRKETASSYVMELEGAQSVR